MGSPISLVVGARAFARDYARDEMPPGYFWDSLDYVPNIIDAPLTGRGGWVWGTDVLDSDIETGILAIFGAGEQALVQTANGTLYQLGPVDGTIVANRGGIRRALQNPVQMYGDVIWMDAAGANTPQIVRSSGGPISAPSSALKGPVGTTWGDYVVVGGAAGEEDTIRFSKPYVDLATSAAWDDKSFQRTASKVTALAALRSVIIVFHAGSTERIRGSTPPATNVTNDDLNVEPLFARAGCPDPKAIAYWNENVIFADEHGVHITDGAVIRNLASQGGILSYWRPLWATRTGIAACTFLDYYIVTVRQPGGPITLICDLNTRQWFRFSNIDAISYVSSGGAIGMERIWAGISGAKRAARISSCFFPVVSGLVADANGVAVLPTFETAWMRLAFYRRKPIHLEGRVRVRFAYLSYDARVSASVAADVGVQRVGEENAPPPLPATLASTLAPVLDIGFLRAPQDTTYTSLGALPETSGYSRYRLPVGKFPYGVAFRVRQTAQTKLTRIYDLGVESESAERSRV